MEIPKIVFHGTFWPDRVIRSPDRLTADVGYICTSPKYEWAHYFAWLRRWRYKAEVGKLSIYEIDTEKLPTEVLRGCIPPEGIDPRACDDKFLKGQEEDGIAERVKIQEWRLPYIPLSAVINLEEEPLVADPELSILLIRPPR